MNLEESIEILRKIRQDCPDLEGTHVILAPPIDVPNSSVEGYYLHFNGVIGSVARKALHTSAVPFNLTIRDRGPTISLYRTIPEKTPKQFAQETQSPTMPGSTHN